MDKVMGVSGVTFVGLRGWGSTAIARYSVVKGRVTEGRDKTKGGAVSDEFAGLNHCRP
jgi:hypothetical protein